MKRIIFALMCFMLFSITAPHVSASTHKDKTLKIEKQSVIVDQNFTTFDAVRIGVNFEQFNTGKVFILENQTIAYFAPKLPASARQIDYGLCLNKINTSIANNEFSKSTCTLTGLRWQANEGYRS